MKLYGFPPSPNTWKVRALAAYLKTPLEFELVDLTKGASHTPAYLAINPTGRTPGPFAIEPRSTSPTPTTIPECQKPRGHSLVSVATKAWL